MPGGSSATTNLQQPPTSQLSIPPTPSTMSKQPCQPNINESPTVSTTHSSSVPAMADTPIQLTNLRQTEKSIESSPSTLQRVNNTQQIQLI